GATVAPRTSTSTSAGPFAPSALMRPSFTTTDPAAITGEVMSPLNRVPMLRKTVVVMSGDRAAELTRDVPADPRGRVGRVVTRVVTWVVDARDRGHPVVREQLVRIGDERGETSHGRTP